MLIFLILGLLLGASVIIFAAENTAVVSVTFLGWQFDGSLALVIVLSVAAGMIISALLYLPGAVGKRIQLSKLKRENIKLQERLNEKQMEVEDEKGKAAATNAYLDDVEKNHVII